MPTLAEIVEKRVHELVRRVDRLEASGVSGGVQEQAPVVVDTSKVDEVSKSVSDLDVKVMQSLDGVTKSVSDLDVKVMQSLDELQERVNGLEQLKSMTSAVDGLSLHVELLTKHLEGLVQRVEKLETSAVAIEPEEESA